MDWSNESYVRLYVRDTPDWRVLPWQSKALFPLLLRKLDLSGVLETRHGARGVAAIVELPIEVVEVGLAGLLEDGSVRETESGYVMPNYIPAQTANKSDKLRQRELRLRRADTAIRSVTARDGVVTSRDAAVTPRDETVTPINGESHAVAEGHAESLSALRCSALPCDAEDPPVVPQGGRRTRRKKLSEPTEKELASVRVVIVKLNEQTGRNYSPETPEHVRLIVALLRKSYTEMDIRQVIWHRASKWADKPEMEEFLRPKTLFGPQNFADYVVEARAAYARWQRDEDARKHRQLVSQPPSPITLSVLGGKQ